MSDEQISELTALKPRTYSLAWRSAEDLDTIYANQMIVSHTGPEFYLVFGEVITPAIAGKIRDDYEGSELEVKPVAKIALPDEVMISISHLLNENVGKFLKKMEDAKESL